jgi:NAD kinase
VVIEKALKLPESEISKTLYFIHEIERSKVNVIITIGGDGTILSAHRYYKDGNIPPIISFYLVRVEKLIV